MVLKDACCCHSGCFCGRGNIRKKYSLGIFFLEEQKIKNYSKCNKKCSNKAKNVLLRF